MIDHSVLCFRIFGSFVSFSALKFREKCLYINLLMYCVTGGKLVYHYKKKLGSVPKCGDCKVKLHGVILDN